MTAIATLSAPALATSPASADLAYREAARRIALAAHNSWSAATNLANRISGMTIENPDLDETLLDYAERREAEPCLDFIDEIVLAGEPFEHKKVRYWARYDQNEDTFVLALEYI